VFDSNGIGGVFKEIGKILIGSLLTPIEWILFGLNKMGAVSDAAFEKFKKFRNSLVTVGPNDVFDARTGQLGRAAMAAGSTSFGGHDPSLLGAGFEADASAIALPDFNAPNAQEVDFQRRYLSQVDINLSDPGGFVDSTSVSGNGNTSISDADGRN
jgi:hypothetical protein